MTERLLLESSPVLRAKLTEDDGRAQDTLNRVIDLYNAWHAAEPGKGYADKAAEWRAKLSESVEGVEPAE